MCHHWQYGNAERLFEEYKNKPKEEIEKKLDEERTKLSNHEKQAIDYYGSLEKVTHGFFSGNLLSSNLRIRSLEYALEGKDPFEEDRLEWEERVKSYGKEK